MRVEAVSVDDDATMHAWYDVVAEAAAADAPGVPMVTYPELIENARATSSRREHFWVGRVADRVIGAYRLQLPLLDNLGTAALTLAIAPEHRHRGNGRVLVAQAVDQARAMGRHRIWVEVIEPLGHATSRAAQFAAAAGFRRALPSSRRVLDLSTLEDRRLAELEATAQAAAEGYHLSCWTGPCPDSLAEDYAALMARMSVDAPLEDLDLEPEHWDAARVREQDALIQRQGRTAIRTVVRYGADGPLVAFSDLGVTRHDPHTAYQWDTLVLSAHRGHRLGLLVKVANLRRLRAHAPEARELHTWNADSNTHMVAINDALGFVPLHREVEWQLDLPDRA